MRFRERTPERDRGLALITAAADAGLLEADVCRQAGQTDRAEALYKQALAIFRDKLDSGDPSIARNLAVAAGSLRALYYAAGDLRQAVEVWSALPRGNALFPLLVQKLSDAWRRQMDKCLDRKDWSDAETFCQCLLRLPSAVEPAADYYRRCRDLLRPLCYAAPRLKTIRSFIACCDCQGEILLRENAPARAAARFLDGIRLLDQLVSAGRDAPALPPLDENERECAQAQFFLGMLGTPPA